MNTLQEQLRAISYRFGEPVEKVAIIIDECNLQHAALSILGRRIDYQRLRENILDGHREVANLPKIITDATPHNEGFVFAMQNRGFEVEAIESQLSNGKHKNRTDPYIHRALYEAGDSDADVVALVSGDGDFEPALRYLKEIKGKRVEVFALREALATSLWAVADRVEFLG
ncbi:MAG: NYN domain-containing protein [Candidatus Latescibacteria bacterium]|nr:NYN domain-containing protein [Candidatus Latescibacterota bacterium]